MMDQIFWQPGISLDEMEKLIIIRAYEHYKKNKTQTAMSLGISIRTLDAKLDQYMMDVKPKTNEPELRRKIEAAMIHFFGDKKKVCTSLGLTMKELNERIKTYVKNETYSGLHVESDAEVPEEQSLPVREQSEVQEMLSNEAPARRPGRPRKEYKLEQNGNPQEG